MASTAGIGIAIDCSHARGSPGTLQRMSTDPRNLVQQAPPKGFDRGGVLPKLARQFNGKTLATTCAGPGESRMKARPPTMIASRRSSNDEQYRGRLPTPNIQQQQAQAISRRFVQRHERFVEQQQLRIDRDGARQGHANGPCPPTDARDRHGRSAKFLVTANSSMARPRRRRSGGITNSTFLEVRCARAAAGRSKDVADRRLCTRYRGQGHAADEAMVEAGDDIEQGRLAAARWPDDADQFSTADLEMEILEGKEHTGPAHCRKLFPECRPPGPSSAPPGGTPLERFAAIPAQGAG